MITIPYSLLIDNRFGRLPDLLQQLKGRYKVVHEEGVSLYTVRHFDDRALASLQNGREVLLEQRSAETVQLVVK